MATYRVGDLELEGDVKLSAALSKHGVEGLGLLEGTRETIEDETLAARGVTEGLLDAANNNLVRDEATRLHDVLDLEAHLGLLVDSLAEHVAGCEVADAVGLLDNRGLGALAAARGADEKHTLVREGRALDTALDLREELLVRRTLEGGRHLSEGKRRQGRSGTGKGE